MHKVRPVIDNCVVGNLGVQNYRGWYCKPPSHCTYREHLSAAHNYKYTGALFVPTPERHGGPDACGYTERCAVRERRGVYETEGTVRCFLIPLADRHVRSATPFGCAFNPFSMAWILLLGIRNFHHSATIVWTAAVLIVDADINMNKSAGVRASPGKLPTLQRIVDTLHTPTVVEIACSR